MKILNFFVSGQTITLRDRVDIASGAEKYLYCKFDYSDEWNGADKAYRFIYSDKVYSAAESLAGLVTVPFEVIKPPYFTIAVGGYNGDTFIPTIGIKIRVCKNSFGDKNADIDAGAEVTQGILAQMLALCTECKSIAEDAKSAWETQKDLWDKQFDTWGTQFGKMVSNSVPSIGTNGNWFIYDNDKKEYTDSGKPSRGIQGIQGVQGPQGIQGVKGDKGDVGEQGIQGEKGDKGDTGAKGDKGDKPIRGVDYWTEEDVSAILADLDGKIADKADKSTTLAGYGIGDAYTISQTDELLSDKLEEVSTADITDNAVTTGKIADKAVTADKLGEDVKKTMDSKADKADLTKYVKNTDYATASKAGIIKTNVSSGTTVNADGELRIAEASRADIALRVGDTKPITPTYLNFAVKCALSDEKRISDMTDTEQANARDVIGAASETALQALKHLSIPHTNVSGYPLSITDSLTDESLTGCKVWGGCGKNLIPYPYFNEFSTKNGVLFSDEGEGKVRVNGTASKDASLLLKYRGTKFTIPKGMFYLSGCPKGGSTSTYFLGIDGYKGDTWKWSYRDVGNGIAFNTENLEYDSINIYIRVLKDSTVNNLIFKPQLEFGSTATTYEQYKTVGDFDSLYGKYQVPITVCGKNVLGIAGINSKGIYSSTISSGVKISYDKDTQIITLNGTSTSSVSTNQFVLNHEISGDAVISAKVIEGTVEGNGYYFGLATTSYALPGDVRIQLTENGIDTAKSAGTRTLEKSGKYVVIQSNAAATYNNFQFQLQIEKGATATEYEPYTNSISNAALGTPLAPGEYIDLIRKKRVNGSTETDILVAGELKTVDSDVNNIICGTTVAPEKTEVEYYQDINKVITELRNAILAQGGNT